MKALDLFLFFSFCCSGMSGHFLIQDELGMNASMGATSTAEGMPGALPARVEAIQLTKLVSQVGGINATLSQFGLPALLPVPAGTVVDSVHMRQFDGYPLAFLVRYKDGTSCCFLITDVEPADPGAGQVDFKWRVKNSIVPEKIVASR